MHESGWSKLLFFFFFGGGGGLTFFWHESSSMVEIMLHTEFGRVWLCRSLEKVGVGFGLWCALVYLRKIRPTQLWVELSWVLTIAVQFERYISKTPYISDKINTNTSQ